MTPTSSPRKNKIVLNDYAYRRDIDHRILIARLSQFEVDLMKEIVYCSLKISIEQLAEQLEADLNDIVQSLDRLSATRLFKRQNMTLIVDKEMRKYYEMQLEKFDDDFEPNMEFLQNSLNQIPIHVLPNWYAIPRTSDNIFASIIEKYFLTPKLYRQYLDELQFDDPLIPQLIQDLYRAPGFKLKSDDLIETYQLTRERFEEYLLLLEYHFVCCLRYEKVGDYWIETITPFQEWLDYLTFETKTKPSPIKDVLHIQKRSQTEFGFIEDLNLILKTCLNTDMRKDQLASLFIEESKDDSYLETVYQKLIQLEWIKEKDSLIQVMDKGAIWRMKPLSEQVNQLNNNPLNLLQTIPFSSPLYNSRNFRQIEKGLRRLTENEWIYLEDFLKGFISPIGNKEPVVLINKGKKWKYKIPTYTNEEKNFIKAVITERLFELGIVNIGTHLTKTCFCLTSFGRVSLI